MNHYVCTVKVSNCWGQIIISNPTVQFKQFVTFAYTTHYYKKNYKLEVHIRDATIHNLDVSIYCHLYITIQRYIARYNQV